MTSELEIQDAVRLALGREPDVILFRNNVGVAERNGRMIRFGVGGPGGADLIGMYRGRFLAIEIKSANGRQSKEQREFEALVNHRGGIYVVLRSVEDAHAWLASMRSAAA